MLVCCTLPPPMTSQPAAFDFDVELSHSNKDKPAVRELRDQLALRGLSVWYDEDELPPGIPWQQLLKEGIHASRSVAVVVGSDGVGPWEDEEMRASLTLAVKDKPAVIPVLLPSAQRPALPPPSHQPLSLEAVLPGAWQVRIQTPFAVGNLQVVLTPQHSFRGELITPVGPSLIEGQWQADPAAAQITLQGRQAAGFQVMPYYALVQVTFFDAQQIVGITAGGEQVTWHKQTPAA